MVKHGSVNHGLGVVALCQGSRWANLRSMISQVAKIWSLQGSNSFSSKVSHPLCGTQKQTWSGCLCAVEMCPRQLEVRKAGNDTGLFTLHVYSACTSQAGAGS